MYKFKPYCLTYLGWKPLGVSGCKLTHPILTPSNLQNGVTFDEALVATKSILSNALNQYPNPVIDDVHVKNGRILLNWLNEVEKSPNMLCTEDTHNMFKRVGEHLFLHLVQQHYAKLYTTTLNSVETHQSAKIVTDNIQYCSQSITTATFGIIAHGVNCQGAMGSGVARAIYELYPVVRTQYIQTFNKLRPSIGYTDFVNVTDGLKRLYVANCYTQEFFGSDGKQYADLNAIQTCLTTVLDVASEMDLPVHLPRIGSDLGGLSWKGQVEPLLVQLATQYPEVPIHIYILPSDAHKM